MGRLHILSADEAVGSPLDWPDVYFSPQYGAAVQETERARWELAMWEPGPVLYPYLKRPIDARWGLGDGFYDLVSPYGYAGTWAPPRLDDREWKEFRRSFRRAAAEKGYVTEVQRMSPFHNRRASLLKADPDLEERRHGDTIAIDLRGGYDSFWQGAEGRCRTAVRKAQRGGYQVTVRPAQRDDFRDRGSFRSLYEGTMRRVGARPYYFFPEAYYLKLLEGLGTSLIAAQANDAEGRPVAAALAMTWAGLLHYHLAGSDPEAARNGVNNLLLDSIIRWGCEKDLHTAHLGGGASPNDRLFRFKRAFGGEAQPFWIVYGVLRPDLYRALIDAYVARNNIRIEDLDRDYFPPYRV